MSRFESFLLAPWPWYVSGPLIGLTVPLLLLLAGKPLGISSNLRNLVSLVLARSKISYFSTNPWKGEFWNLLFAGGLVIGGFLAVHFLSKEAVAFLPGDYHSLKGAILLSAGGILIGFGTRYGNGCTSGHAITGLSNFSITSLYGTLSFFASGLLSALILYLIQKYSH